MTIELILNFSRRGKPTDNATTVSFNGRFREECLDVHWFASLKNAQQKIDVVEIALPTAPLSNRSPEPSDH